MQKHYKQVSCEHGKCFLLVDVDSQHRSETIYSMPLSRTYKKLISFIEIVFPSSYLSMLPAQQSKNNSSSYQMCLVKRRIRLCLGSLNTASQSDQISLGRRHLRTDLRVGVTSQHALHFLSNSKCCDVRLVC